MAANNQIKHRFFGGNVIITIIIWLTLCLIGWFNIYAAVFDPNNPQIFNMGTNYGKQSLFIISAAVIGMVDLLIDARFSFPSHPLCIS